MSRWASSRRYRDKIGRRWGLSPSGVWGQHPGRRCVGQKCQCTCRVGGRGRGQCGRAEVGSSWWSGPRGEDVQTTQGLVGLVGFRPDSAAEEAAGAFEQWEDSAASPCVLARQMLVNTSCSCKFRSFSETAHSLLHFYLSIDYNRDS